MDSHTIAMNVMDLPFARDIGELVLNQFQTDLISNAENNWCESQVKMLKALLASTCQGIEYGDAYEQMEREEQSDKKTTGILPRE